MELKQLTDKLGLKVYPAVLEDYIKDVSNEYEKDGVFFLNREYISMVHKKCNCFNNSLEHLFAAAEDIVKNSDMAFYSLLVYRALENREKFMSHLGEITFPEGDGLGFDFLPFMILIPTILPLYEYLEKKNVEKNVIEATVQQYEACLYIYKERYDKLGLNKLYFDWLQSYVDFKYLNIGRLRFEMVPLGDSIRVYKNKNNDSIKILLEGGMFNRRGLRNGTPPIDVNEEYKTAYFLETDEFTEGYEIKNGRVSKLVKLPSDEWECVLKKGDAVLSVHIPPNESFTKEACVLSYEKAEKILDEHFPEFEFKAFRCNSWLLDPELKNILKPESNILKFQEEYNLFPMYTQGDSVLNFVFKLRFKTFEDMPEDTSLQRALKKKYMAGEYIYEYGGVFLRKNM